MLEVDLGPGIRAFFTTREQGLSRAPWASLNLGLAVGDAPETVRANRAYVDTIAGAPVSYANQVHGCATAVVTEPLVAESAGDVDALVTALREVPLGVYVADCVPVLLADPHSGIVAAVHAGRPGVELGVVTAALQTMRAQGADLTSVRAAVGPSICGSCYEVPGYLRAQVGEREPTTVATTSWGTPSLDLAAGVLAQLDRAGVTRVTVLAECTRTDPRFFSHRLAVERAATGGDPRTGRFAGVVAAIGGRGTR